MPAVQLYNGLCYLYLGRGPRNRGTTTGEMTVECLFLHSAAALATAALPKVIVDVQSKLMHDLMHHTYGKLPRKENTFLQFLCILIYWRYTFSYLAAFTRKAGNLEEGVSFRSTFFNEGKEKTLKITTSISLKRFQPPCPDCEYTFCP